MKHIVAVIGRVMGFTERGNDKAYLDLIRAELSVELIMLHSALVAFFEKHPIDPWLGMDLQNYPDEWIKRVEDFYTQRDSTEAQS